MPESSSVPSFQRILSLMVPSCEGHRAWRSCPKATEAYFRPPKTLVQFASPTVQLKPCPRTPGAFPASPSCQCTNRKLLLCPSDARRNVEDARGGHWENFAVGGAFQSRPLLRGRGNSGIGRSDAIKFPKAFSSRPTYTISSCWTPVPG